MQLGKQTSQAAKDLLLALSLANLCMIDPWTRVLGISPSDIFFRRNPPSRMDLVSVMVAVLFLCAAFWSVGTLTREFGGRWIKGTVRTAFLIVLFGPDSHPIGSNPQILVGRDTRMSPLRERAPIYPAPGAGVTCAGNRGVPGNNR